MPAPLVEALARHARVEVVRDGVYAYRPRRPHVRDRASLMREVREAGGGGLPACEVSDAYAKVNEDVAALAEDRMVIVLESAERKEKDKRMLYARSDAAREMETDEEVRELWDRVEMPRGRDLEEALERFGHMSAEEAGTSNRKKARVAGAKRAGAGARKAAKRRRVQLTTNPHLAGQLNLDGDEQ